MTKTLYDQGNKQRKQLAICVRNLERLGDAVTTKESILR